MKIRTGFVSNSSSSSFIIGIVNTGIGGKGKVFDPTENFGYDFILKDLNNGNYNLTMESFTGREVSCEIKPGESFLYLNSSGPDGDENFTVYDDNGNYDYMDYDIDLEDFDNNDISTYNTIQSLGGQVSYGAGRDG